jgi:glycosyltransferase involved in cell wall biosynthesis
MDDNRPLTILHLLRAPLGGLFRHVADLLREQVDRGHRVGVIADATRLGPHPEGTLSTLAPRLALGVTRIPIGRHLSPGDISAGRRIGQIIRATDPDVVHGHGAKGGAFARLSAPGHRAVRVYTPHGGSLLYRPNTLASAFYTALERILGPRTDLFLFESEFISRIYRAKVATPKATERVVNNGVGPAEFADVIPQADAADILFIGELRDIKGVDVVIDAIGALRDQGIALTAAIVGSGPQRAELEAHAARLGLSKAITFHGAIPAREAFRLGKLAIVASRAESMPYIVLETAAAGLPLISTNVGGIPDIFGPQTGRLLNPDDRPALVDAIRSAIKNPETMSAATANLRERVRTEFSIEQMVNGVIAAYRDALRQKSSISH